MRKKYLYFLAVFGLLLTGLSPAYALTTTSFKGSVSLFDHQFQFTVYPPSPKHRAHEVTGEFSIRDNQLHLKTIMKDYATGDGFVTLIPPFHVDFGLELAAMDLNEFLDLWVPHRQYESAGEVSGSIKISGIPERLSLKGKLHSPAGFVKNLSFESMDLNIEGFYPYLYISQSSLTKRNGMTFQFEGPFDLSAREGYKSQLKRLEFSPVVEETSFDREWTLKRSENDDSRMEIKYLLRKDVPGTVPPSEKDVGMLGIEQTVKF